MTARLPLPMFAAALVLLALAVGLTSCDRTEEDTSQVATSTPITSRTTSSSGTPEAKTQTASPTPFSATPGATLPTDWESYQDANLGFSFAHPAGLTKSEQTIDLSAKGGIPATQLRVISFDRQDGVPVVGVSFTPNAAGLTLEEWIRTVPGWPCEPMAYPTCEPTDVTAGGERGIRFSLDTLGDPAATIYFAHDGYIFSLSGNVFGSGEGGYGPALTEADFAKVVENFRFPQ